MAPRAGLDQRHQPALKRRDLKQDFPLRGFVVCAACDTPLTGCWSARSQPRYRYDLCRKRGCSSYGKSIEREDLQGEFEAMLRSVQPPETLFKGADRKDWRTRQDSNL
ncbi:zinc ribbon domain-containing protein [Mangrovibrevibacter kandeliae]|uniref:zinc ribbon domain-containing protein n=1 Tax=Mangrovibrevibacter kandeliae TaxID=2968473 RepID=UPI00389A5501